MTCQEYVIGHYSKYTTLSIADNYCVSYAQADVLWYIIVNANLSYVLEQSQTNIE